MVAKRLREFLDEAGVRYVTITHSKAYTAPEVAASAHVRGRELAKTVVVRIDSRLALAMVSANHHVDLESIRSLTGAGNVAIASEAEFRDAFPGCEVGSACLPFGAPVGGRRSSPTRTLPEDDEIAFNAGSHTELIRMRWIDFARLAQPKVLEFARS
jgi:Ala-tRNA(Pro) deacylase